MRAVSVRVNEVIGVAGYVLPGQPGRRSRHREPDRIARGHDLEGRPLERAGADRPARASSRTRTKNKPMQVTVVTLLVNPEQAERLALASTEGKIQLALRNPLDQGAPDTPGIRTAGLMGGKPAPAGPAPRTAPAPQARPEAARRGRARGGQPSVEIIRGDKRSSEVIK